MDSSSLSLFSPVSILISPTDPIAAPGIMASVGAAGFITYQMLKRVDKYRVEVLLTLALAMAVYALAGRSAPLSACCRRP